MEIDENGEREAVIHEGDENGNMSDYLLGIQYEGAEHISTDDVGCRKVAYGYIDNVQLEEDDKETFIFQLGNKT